MVTDLLQNISRIFFVATEAADKIKSSCPALDNITTEDKILLYKVPLCAAAILVFICLCIYVTIIKYGRLADGKGKKFLSKKRDDAIDNGTNEDKSDNQVTTEEKENSAESSEKKTDAGISIEFIPNNTSFFNQIIAPLNVELKSTKFPTVSMIDTFISERISEKEEAVSNRLPYPVLFGLLGTVVGILVSLWDVDKIKDGCIEYFMPGIAMAIATTALGLVVTIFMNWRFHKCKYEIAAAKDHFMSFVRKLDLPTDNELASLIERLGANLSDFNTKFNTNIGSFSESIKGIGDLDKLTEKLDTLVDKMKGINLESMVTNNFEIVLNINEIVSKLNNIAENFASIKDLDIARVQKCVDALDNYMKSSEANCADLISNLTLQLSGVVEDLKAKFDTITIYAQNSVQNVADASSQIITETQEKVSNTIETLENNADNYIKNVSASSTESMKKVSETVRRTMDDIENMKANSFKENPRDQK